MKKKFVISKYSEHFNSHFRRPPYCYNLKIKLVLVNGINSNQLHYGLEFNTTFVHL